MPSFDVRQPQGLYAAWDVLQSSKPACMLYSPLMAKIVPKWSTNYLVGFLMQPSVTSKIVPSIELLRSGATDVC